MIDAVRMSLQAYWPPARWAASQLFFGASGGGPTNSGKKEKLAANWLAPPLWLFSPRISPSEAAERCLVASEQMARQKWRWVKG